MRGAFLLTAAGGKRKPFLPAADSNEVDLYLFWGQSNMQGTEANSAGLSNDRKTIPLCKIWNNSNAFVTYSTTTNQAMSGKYGPDMEVIYQISLTATQDFYVVKKALTGAPLAAESGREDWSLSTNELYLDFKTYVLDAIANLQALEKVPVIRCVFGQQGERDARLLATANAYYTNMRALYDQMKTDFSSPNVKFVHGRIHEDLILVSGGSEYPYVSTVRAAQELMQTNDPTKVKWVTIDADPLSEADGVHLSQPELLGARMYTAYQSF